MLVRQVVNMESLIQTPTAPSITCRIMNCYRVSFALSSPQPNINVWYLNFIAAGNSIEPKNVARKFRNCVRLRNDQIIVNSTRFWKFFIKTLYYAQNLISWGHCMKTCRRIRRPAFFFCERSLEGNSRVTSYINSVCMPLKNTKIEDLTTFGEDDQSRRTNMIDWTPFPIVSDSLPPYHEIFHKDGESCISLHLQT